MKQLILFAVLSSICLLQPIGARADVQTSDHYSINGGRIVSGGTHAATTTMNQSNIAIGQGVFIPAEGSSSADYRIQLLAISSPELGGIRNGDINGDGVVDIVDALSALRATVGIAQLSKDEMIRGDVYPIVKGIPAGDGNVDLGDAVIILRKVVGMNW